MKTQRSQSTRYLWRKHSLILNNSNLAFITQPQPENRKLSTPLASDDKTEKLQNLCHSLELQLEEAQVAEQKVRQDLQRMERKFKDHSKYHSTCGEKIKDLERQVIALRSKNVTMSERWQRASRLNAKSRSGSRSCRSMTSSFSESVISKTQEALKSCALPKTLLDKVYAELLHEFDPQPLRPSLKVKPNLQALPNEIQTILVLAYEQLQTKKQEVTGLQSKLYCQQEQWNREAVTYKRTAQEFERLRASLMGTLQLADSFQGSSIASYREPLVRKQFSEIKEIPTPVTDGGTCDGSPVRTSFCTTPIQSKMRPTTALKNPFLQAKMHMPGKH